MKAFVYLALTPGLLLFTTASAKAQDTQPAPNVPAASVEASRKADKSFDRGIIRYQFRNGTIKTIANPRFREVADKKFWLLAAENYASSVFDIESFHHCHRVDPSCREFNPLMGQKRPRQYAVKFAINTVFVWAIYKARREQILQEEAHDRDGWPSWSKVDHAWTAVNLGTGLVDLLHKRPQRLCPTGTACTLSAHPSASK